MPLTMKPALVGQIPRQTALVPITDELCGPQGEKLHGKLHGDYFAQSQTAQHFCATDTAGAQIRLTSSTTFGFAIFNPQGSGVLAVPTFLNLGYKGSTEAPASIVLSTVSPAGAAVGTGLPILTATDLTVQNMRVGSPQPSKARVFSGGTLTAVTTLFIATGISQYTTTSGTGIPSPVRQYPFYGSVILEPNTAMFLQANVSTVAQYQISIVWYETTYV